MSCFARTGWSSMIRSLHFRKFHHLKLIIGDQLQSGCQDKSREHTSFLSHAGGSPCYKHCIFLHYESRRRNWLVSHLYSYTHSLHISKKSHRDESLSHKRHNPNRSRSRYRCLVQRRPRYHARRGRNFVCTCRRRHSNPGYISTPSHQLLFRT